MIAGPTPARPARRIERPPSVELVLEGRTERSLSFWTQIGTALGQIDSVYLVAFLAFVSIHFFAEPMRWQIYLSGWERISHRLLWQIFCLTAFLSYSLPMKMGIPVRIFLLKKRCQLDLTSITAILVLDGLIYYGGWMLSALVGIYLLIELNILIDAQISMIHLLLAALILMALGFLARRRLGTLAFVRRGTEKIRDKFSQLLTIIDRIDLRRILIAGAIVLADIISNVLRHWALLAMLGYDLAWDTLFVITSVSIFAGLASLMPAGLGGYDAVLVLLLVKSSIPLEAAILVTVFNRMGTILVSAVLGVIAGYQLGLNPFKRDWNTETT